MKRILCYGDSNTWGSAAFSKGRLPSNEQWPNILQKELGDNFEVIQEGLPGRIAGELQARKPYYNGQSFYKGILTSSAPLDFIIIALGTNDCQRRYRRNAKQIIDDIMWYNKTTKNLKNQNLGKIPEVIFVAPANFRSVTGYFFANQKVRNEFVELMQKRIKNLVLADDIDISGDGVHFSKRGQLQMAQKILQEIKARV